METLQEIKKPNIELPTLVTKYVFFHLEKDETYSRMIDPESFKLEVNKKSSKIEMKYEKEKIKGDLVAIQITHFENSPVLAYIIKASKKEENKKTKTKTKKETK